MILPRGPVFWTFKHNAEGCGAIFQISDEKIEGRTEFSCPNCHFPLEAAALKASVEAEKAFRQAAIDLRRGSKLQVLLPYFQRSSDVFCSEDNLRKEESD